MKQLLVFGLGLTLFSGMAVGDDFKRERGRDNDAAKDANEGKPAPELQVTNWINTESPLKLSDLKGKVVIIDFWGVW
ncbi:MAG: hypothetical protein HKN23_17665 [Verrucomicrobiales bacterium]|nr:hypothetical protein [Verrucomicrobiales bacterium]